MPQEPPLCPVTKDAIETIARRLRNLPCDNSLVAMNLHRVARDLEAITAGHGSIESCCCNGCLGAPIRLQPGLVATPTMWSAQQCGE